MEPRHFELTPEQKGIVASLLKEAGQPAPTLAAAIVAVLEELQREMPAGGACSREQLPTAPEPSAPASKPIWEIAEELFSAIPDDELARLPTDGATQHDHYIYGTPKRPV